VGAKRVDVPVRSAFPDEMVTYPGGKPTSAKSAADVGVVAHWESEQPQRPDDQLRGGRQMQ
jgi:hypothetical protein